ncbi:MAG TPA: response regulator [Caldithrix sp.]|nr:response regulator [Caldithrix sp.]
MKLRELLMQKKILIADRDPEVGQSLKEYLDLDYEVFLANDALEIFTILKKTKIDLFLTGIDIPNVSILDLLQRVKNKYPDLPVFVMYIFCDCTFEMEKNVRELAQAIFLKPFDMKKLKLCIDAAFSS